MNIYRTWIGRQEIIGIEKAKGQEGSRSFLFLGRHGPVRTDKSNMSLGSSVGDRWAKGVQRVGPLQPCSHVCDISWTTGVIDSSKIHTLHAYCCLPRLFKALLSGMAARVSSLHLSMCTSLEIALRTSDLSDRQDSTPMKSLAPPGTTKLVMAL